MRDMSRMDRRMDRCIELLREGGGSERREAAYRLSRTSYFKIVERKREIARCLETVDTDFVVEYLGLMLARIGERDSGEVSFVVREGYLDHLTEPCMGFYGAVILNQAVDRCPGEVAGYQGFLSRSLWCGKRHIERLCLNTLLEAAGSRGMDLDSGVVYGAASFISENRSGCIVEASLFLSILAEKGIRLPDLSDRFIEVMSSNETRVRQSGLEGYDLILSSSPESLHRAADRIVDLSRENELRGEARYLLARTCIQAPETIDRKPEATRVLEKHLDNVDGGRRGFVKTALKSLKEERSVM